MIHISTVGCVKQTQGAGRVGYAILRALDKPACIVQVRFLAFRKTVVQLASNMVAVGGMQPRHPGLGGQWE